MHGKLHIISSANINRAKWDDCVNGSTAGMIYAYTFYLDHLADNWSGVVMDDYEAVMPVPWRMKFGIRYAYDVPFMQQCGWYAKNTSITEGPFLQQLFRFVKYGSYTFNHSNKLHIKGLRQCNNYTIHLGQTYRHLREKYSADALGNLKKAARANLLYRHCVYTYAIKMYRLTYQARFANTSPKNYANFAELCKTLTEKKMVFARMAVDENTGIVLATALFLQDGRRIYNMMNTTIEQGREKSANHFLLDNVLKEFAGTGLLFDFEGSDIHGIKLFYEKFGAVNQPYTRLEKFNRLPFPLSLLK